MIDIGVPRAARAAASPGFGCRTLANVNTTLETTERAAVRDMELAPRIRNGQSFLASQPCFQWRRSHVGISLGSIPLYTHVDGLSPLRSCFVSGGLFTGAPGPPDGTFGSPEQARPLQDLDLVRLMASSSARSVGRRVNRRVDYPQGRAGCTGAGVCLVRGE
jgi:hypothetical protein